MSGVIDVIQSGAPGGGGGAVVGSWGNLYGHLIGNNNLEAVSGFTGAHQLGISWTGSPLSVYVYTASGDFNITGTGAFAVTPGEKIGFIIYSGASATKSGTVTIVDNTAGGAAVATFNYAVTAP
jgi:hypothetical protein